LRAAALVIKKRVEVFTATNNREIDTSFANLVEGRMRSLLAAARCLSTAAFSLRRWPRIITCQQSITTAE
jgi:hypothetical protein